MKYFGDVFEELGFTPHLSRKSNKEDVLVYLSNLDEPGVIIELNHEKGTFTIRGGDIKYFGSISFAEMHLGKRDVKELKHMIDTMRHYVEVIDNNQPW